MLQGHNKQKFKNYNVLIYVNKCTRKLIIAKVPNRHLPVLNQHNNVISGINVLIGTSQCLLGKGKIRLNKK